MTVIIGNFTSIFLSYPTLSYMLIILQTRFKTSFVGFPSSKMKLYSSIFLKLLSINNTIVLIDVFKLKNIHYGMICHCESNYNYLLMQKIFNDDQISVASHRNGVQLENNQFFNSKFGIIVDAACEDWDEVFSINKDKLKTPYTWIVVTADLTSTVAKLSQYPIEIDSDVIILMKHENNTVYNLYAFFHTGFNTKGTLIVEHLGYFDSKLHITQRPRLQASMEGVVLKCPIVIIDNVVNETYIQFLDTLRPPHADPVHKFKFYRVLRYLEGMYKFKCDFQRTSSWGYLRNGTFDGMVGAFQQHMADVGGSGVFFRTDRAKYVDYVVEIWKTRPCFIFRHPKYPGGFYTVFTRPLSITVWYYLMVVLGLAGILMCGMLRVKSRMFDGVDCSLSLIFVFITSAIGQQGIPIHSNSMSIKIVIISTLIFSLTIYQYYNATVVSTLLREPATSIRNLEDLLHSKMEIGIEDTLYDKDYFKRTTDPTALSLFHNKIVTGAKHNFFNPDHGMALVKRGGFAFHLDSLTGYRIMRKTFTEREICDALEIQLYPPQHTGVVLKKGSPYKEHFAVGIRKTYEAGVMSRLHTVWDESKPLCIRTPDSSVFSVTIRDFSMALVVLTFGMVLALIALVWEIVFFKINSKHIPFIH